jgi:hypothetical protein
VILGSLSSGEAHRGAEVGRKLVQRLGRELRHREIYDIGVRAPPATHRFFAECGFGPDTEGASLMALPLAHLAAEAASASASAGGSGFGGGGRSVGGAGPGAGAGAGVGGPEAKVWASRESRESREGGGFDGEGVWCDEGGDSGGGDTDSRGGDSGGGDTDSCGGDSGGTEEKVSPSLGDLSEVFFPGRTLKDNGDGLRSMLLRAMDNADRAAAAGGK